MTSVPAAAERRILTWLDEQRESMLELLERLVSIDSGSRNKEGVDAVGAVLRGFLADHGITSETVPGSEFGDAICARIGPQEGQPILLMGHRDTVFPKGEAARRPFHIKDSRAYGPGVADMKGGLMMNAFVMAAFAEVGAPVPLSFLCTGDEEIGSPFSRKVIEDQARKSRAVFNAEPGRANGAVVTGRKGGIFMRIDVRGKAAHSGANFEQGISAIEELARKTIALHAVSDVSKGTTVNVGVIAGGQTVNTVAPHAWCELDLRFITPADRDAAMRRIEDIVATSYVPGTLATLDRSGDFLPLVESESGKALYRHYAACAQMLGLTVPAEFTGGCADSGFTAGVGTATLCATGPIGGRAHSPDEFLDILSIVPRAQTLALAVARLDGLV